MLSLILYIQLLQDLTNKSKLVAQVYQSNLMYDKKMKEQYNVSSILNSTPKQ